MNKIIIFCFILFTFNQIQGQKTLPQISLKNTEGNLVNVSEIDTSNVTVFSFWATWCIPCINELDAINEYYNLWQVKTNVKIIAVSIDDSRSVSRVKPLVNGKEWEYQILLDTNQEFQRAVNATSIPYVLIVKNNKIVYTHSSYFPGSEIELFEKIKKYAN